MNMLVFPPTPPKLTRLKIVCRLPYQVAALT